MAEETQQTEEQQPTQKKAAVPRAKKASAAKKRADAHIVVSKKKEAIARVSIKKGNGAIRLNGFDINTLEPKFVRENILTPVHISDTTSTLAKGVDIHINVRGGGVMAQMQAARRGIAKAMVAYNGTDALKSQFSRDDIVDDPRRVEPKKFKGPKARARFQKSYR